MSVFIGYPSFMAYQMMKASKPIPGSSPTRHGLSPVKPTRTKIVLLLPTLRAMVMILYCLILVLQKGVATMKKGNMLAIWLLMGWMIELLADPLHLIKIGRLLAIGRCCSLKLISYLGLLNKTAYSYTIMLMG